MYDVTRHQFDLLRQTTQCFRDTADMQRQRAQNDAGVFLGLGAIIALLLYVTSLSPTQPPVLAIVLGLVGCLGSLLMAVLNTHLHKGTVRAVAELDQLLDCIRAKQEWLEALVKHNEARDAAPAPPYPVNAERVP